MNYADVPVLLAQKDELANETLAEIKRLGAKQAVIIGGTRAVPDSHVKAAEKACG